MNPSQLKTQLSLDGISLSDQQNLEIWVLLDKLARIEFGLYMEEKKSLCEGKAKTNVDISQEYKQVA
ncbi:MAG: hypothetical protein RLZZ306_2783 [Bacteroidota bacterium]|jgi:hypothetical protein